jgi:N-acetyl-gamma-glutamyl-phosphate reductase
MKTLKVALVGARGYSGLELSRLLLGHPNAQLIDVYSSNTQWQLAQDIIVPSAKNVNTRQLDQLEANAKNYDVIFFATSAGQSAEWIPKLLEHTQIIDLSGAFRLNWQQTQKFYKLELDEKYLSPANYGLSPWNKCASRFISNPGCYVTATLMALIPLLKENLITTDVVIDAKSGTTGAGRSPKDSTNFSEISQEIHPYKITNHQHEPEIIRYLSHFASTDIDPIFTTTLLPIPRGILSSIYTRLQDGVGVKQIHEAYEYYYREYPLLQNYWLQGDDLGFSWKTSLKRVVNTPFTQLAYTAKDNKLYLFSMIDNLLKGAASQAVENFNAMFELPVTTGLIKETL